MLKLPWKECIRTNSPFIVKNCFSGHAKGSGIPYDPNRALYRYKESARNGNVLAMKVLSGIYKLGQLGIQNNEVEAQHWKEMAKEAEAKK